MGAGVERRPELLAPAGSSEALLAAIRSGADAVYLGGRRFSARQYAANFGEEEMERAVGYAHARGVRVYVAVNTLVGESELEEAVHYLAFLYGLGVDAVLLQDLGLLRLAREAVPRLAIHASTQMTVQNAPAARLLAGRGLRRVVLARELALPDIQNIVRDGAVEVEVFAHGALCFSYSGQCLLSSMIGGRSGNRGRCAQPCRLPYSLLQEGTQQAAAQPGPGPHILSTRDLCTLEFLPGLVEAGVAALKLEGRMKRPEYVATVVRVYRRALDRALEDPDNYRTGEEEKLELAQAFNREFTSGYFLGNQGRLMMAYQRPSNRGTFLGRIVSLHQGKGRGLVRMEQPLRRGDGLEVWVSQGGRRGLKAGRFWWKGEEVEEAPAGAAVELDLPAGARPGDRVFKTFDARLAEMARVGEEELRIPLRGEVTAAPGRPLEVVFLDPEGVRGSGRTSFLAEVARKHPLTPALLKEQLGRLGDTPFLLEEISLNLADNLMVPLSELNAARRLAVADLLEGRRKIRAERSAGEEPEVAPRRLLPSPGGRPAAVKPLLAVSVGSLEATQAALEAGADRVYLGGERFRGQPFPLASQQQAVSLCRKWGRQAVIITPRIWHPGEEAEVWSYLEEVLEWGLEGLLVANLGTLELCRRAGKQAPLYGDYPLNVFNTGSLAFLAEMGLQGVTLSPELTLGQVEEMARAGLETECLVHGQLPLMVSEQCALGAVLGGREPGANCSQPCRKGRYFLEDRRGYRFPLRADLKCRFHLYNARELCLLPELPRFLPLGLHSLRLEMKGAGQPQVRAAVEAYREALDKDWTGGMDQGRLEELKASLLSLAPSGFTRGHYFRGVL